MRSQDWANSRRHALVAAAGARPHHHAEDQCQDPEQSEHGQGAVGEPPSALTFVDVVVRGSGSDRIRIIAALTPVDWIIVGFTLLMAVWGYAQGLIVGGLSLVGFAAGALAGSRVGPLLLSEGSSSPYAPVFALGGALLVGGIVASVLEVLGFRLRRGLGGRLGVVDGLGGSLLVGALGLGLVWVVGSVALQTPGARDLRRPIQRSAILAS